MPSQRKRSAGRRAAGCATWLTVLALLGYLMIQAFVRQMLYPMPAVPVPEAPAPIEEVRLESTKGDTINGWYGPAVAEEPEFPGKVQVLFLHGNGENLVTLHRSGVFEEFRSLGAAVLAIDYPGYGRSEGRPSQQANVRGAVAGCEWLAARDPEAHNFVMGWSLGAGVAAQVARLCSSRLDGIILISAWNDLPSLARDHFPALLVRLALRDTYDSNDALRGVDLPMLMIHGDHDQLIATRHGRRLRDELQSAGRHVTWVEVQGAGHNDLMGRREVWLAVADFFRRVPANR